MKQCFTTNILQGKNSKKGRVLKMNTALKGFCKQSNVKYVDLITFKWFSRMKKMNKQLHLLTDNALNILNLKLF